jgi:hypothetical protein
MVSPPSYPVILTKPFLDVAVAQGKAQIQPDRVLDDLGGEPMAPVAEQGHANIFPDPPITPGRFRDNAA